METPQNVFGFIWPSKPYFGYNSLMDCQGNQSQNEGQDDMGEIKEQGGDPPPRCFKVPWFSWSSFWLSAPWQSITLFQSIKLSFEACSTGSQGGGVLPVSFT